MRKRHSGTVSKMFFLHKRAQKAVTMLRELSIAPFL